MVHLRTGVVITLASRRLQYVHILLFTCFFDIGIPHDWLAFIRMSKACSLPEVPGALSVNGASSHACRICFLACMGMHGAVHCASVRWEAESTCKHQNKQQQQRNTRKSTKPPEVQGLATDHRPIPRGTAGFSCR